ncbi:hypothetical protein BZA05DRAFT_394461 [Tricharina praecox]|uniref:uncharacterized protein n=1 Tax=Tricharina praecox TaxID=43433 RepID=UPI00221F222C|nr:uncharacterized protein BZA05DRAFT_394461 [Tricharina praecox]KAI5853723.1 hypothetical protein BZA05DRAFT_394461 [Tricharina praecox]
MTTLDPSDPRAQLERARFTTHAEILAIHAGFGKLKERYPIRPDVYEKFALHAHILGVCAPSEEEGGKECGGGGDAAELSEPEPEPEPPLEPVPEIEAQPEAEPEPEPLPSPEPSPEPQPVVSRKRARPQSQNLRNSKPQPSKPKAPTRASKRARNRAPPPPPPPPSAPPISKRKSHAVSHPNPGDDVLVNRIPELPPPRRKYGRGRAAGLDINMFLELCARERRRNRQWGVAGNGGCLLQRNLRRRK